MVAFPGPLGDPEGTPPHQGGASPASSDRQQQRGLQPRAGVHLRAVARLSSSRVYAGALSVWATTNSSSSTSHLGPRRSRPADPARRRRAPRCPSRAAARSDPARRRANVFQDCTVVQVGEQQHGRRDQARSRSGTRAVPKRTPRSDDHPEQDQVAGVDRRVGGVVAQREGRDRLEDPRGQLGGRDAEPVAEGRVRLLSTPSFRASTASTQPCLQGADGTAAPDAARPDAAAAPGPGRARCARRRAPRRGSPGTTGDRAVAGCQAAPETPAYARQPPDVLGGATSSPISDIHRARAAIISTPLGAAIARAVDGDGRAGDHDAQVAATGCAPRSTPAQRASPHEGRRPAARWRSASRRGRRRRRRLRGRVPITA